MQTYGGKGANQAVGAARAGGDVFFINCVGDDDNSRRMVEQLRTKEYTLFRFQEKGIASG